MLVDCDVVGFDLLLRQGRTGDVVGRAVDVEPRLGEADTEVEVSFARVVGTAEVAHAAETMDPAAREVGVARIREGLARARELHLLYEVYLCLGALADATGDPDAQAEHLDLAATLGIVTGG